MLHIYIYINCNIYGLLPLKCIEYTSLCFLPLVSQRGQLYDTLFASLDDIHVALLNGSSRGMNLIKSEQLVQDLNPIEKGGKK